MKQLVLTLIAVACFQFSFAQTKAELEARQKEAQKATYDIVKYSAPKGWTETKAEGNISYSRIDGGSWAQIAIYQYRQSEGDIQADFDKDWNELIANGRSISEPEKTQPQTADGFTVMSGSGVWQYNGANVASMLTVYSNKNICVAILCNATAMPYLKEYQTMLGTLDLDAGKVAENPETQNNSKTNATSANNSSLAGLWTDYQTENSGYVNGYPQTTGGYMRSEYLLKADGTYVFRTKNWMVYGAKYILFIYETGTYSVSGNQITFSPKTGKGGWWNKTSRTSEWGSFAKSSTDYKLEKKTYPFEIRAYSKPTLVLKTGNTTGVLEYRYTKKDNTNESMIDNPPGFKP